MCYRTYISHRRVQFSDCRSNIQTKVPLKRSIWRFMGHFLTALDLHARYTSICPNERREAARDPQNLRSFRLAQSSKLPAIIRKKEGEAGVYWALGVSLYWIRTTRDRFNGMNSTSAHFLGKNLLQSGRRLGATLCVFLLTAVPALAEPVRINQLVQTLTSSQGTPDLKLNTLLSQDPATKASTPQTGPQNETTLAGTPSQGGAKTDSLLSGLTVTSEGQRLGVDIVEEGEVEGTICDCGEILVAAGAFPKWPLVFLAAVPLVFINQCETCDENPSSTPTPTPPTTPTPEPASLLLFGTGLLAAGAGLRRRYGKSKRVEPAHEEE